MQISDHFNGRRFFNPAGARSRSLRDILRWTLRREPGHWEKWVEIAPGPPPPARVDDLRVTFVNHSTVLVQMHGLNLLLDPIWSKRCSPFSWVGPARHHAPGIRFEDLPQIDAVLVSHTHYDHLDLPTLRRLAKRDRPAIFAGIGTRAILERAGIPGGRDLDWHEAARLGGLEIVCAPAQHYSNRTPFDLDKVLWCGFVVRGPAGTVFFGGDTGYGPHFKEVRERYGPMRLAILPIAAFRPEWFMKPIHMSPQDALRAAADLEAGTGLGVHFGTFHLADDGQWEGRDLVRSAVAERGLRFWALDPGEGRDVPALNA